MAESADDPELFWVDPNCRGILPLEAFHVPRRLQRVLRRGGFDVRVDSAFAAVIRGCAEASETRPATWINDEIVRLYSALFERGAAHSVECWHGGELVGGLYGVSLGAAFFGESMFSIEISRARYHRLLAEALRYRAAFPRDPPGPGGLGADGAAGGGGDAPGGALHSSRLRS